MRNSSIKDLFALRRILFITVCTKGTASLLQLNRLPSEIATQFWQQYYIELPIVSFKCDYFPHTPNENKEFN